MVYFSQTFLDTPQEDEIYRPSMRLQVLDGWIAELVLETVDANGEDMHFNSIRMDEKQLTELAQALLEAVKELRK